MLSILFSPLKAIAKAKASHNLGRAFLIVIIASLLAGLTVYMSKNMIYGRNLKVALYVALILLVLELVLALFFQLALHILSQRGGYYEALTSLGHYFLVITFAFFISGLLGFVPKINNTVTIIVSVLSGFVILWGLVMGNALMMRTAMELFHTDLFTVLIGMFVVYFGITISIYIIMIKVFVGSVVGNMFGTFSSLAGANLGSGFSGSGGLTPFG